MRFSVRKTRDDEVSVKDKITGEERFYCAYSPCEHSPTGSGRRYVFDVTHDTLDTSMYPKNNLKKPGTRQDLILEFEESLSKLIRSEIRQINNFL